MVSRIVWAMYWLISSTADVVCAWCMRENASSSCAGVVLEGSTTVKLLFFLASDLANARKQHASNGLLVADDGD